MQRFCPEYSRGILNDTFQQSSDYTSINKLSPTQALVCYERQTTFHFSDCNKPPVSLVQLVWLKWCLPASHSVHKALRTRAVSRDFTATLHVYRT